MKITKEENLMYQVMEAVYSSGIPVDFKGAMVLKACLHESGYAEDVRHTVDIDANWYSDTPPTAEQMVDSLQTALQKKGINLKIVMNRMYGEGRSAGFQCEDMATGEALFSMDIDVNRPVQPTQIYHIGGIQFRGISPSQMIADKLSAISTDKVFRRIKDVVDLYYLSHVFVFDYASVMQILKDSGRKLDNFQGFLYGTNQLKHAYEKFRFVGDVQKPLFEEVYATVKTYIKEAIPKTKDRDVER